MRALALLVVVAQFLAAGCMYRPPRAFEAIPPEEAKRVRAEAMALPVPEAAEEFIATAVDDLPEPSPPKAEGELRFHSIPVGAGSCHLIECPGNTSPIIYDCGSIGETSNSFSREQVAEYFDEILGRYDDEPIVIVSHGDQDHYNHIPEAMGVLAANDTGRKAKVIYMGGVRSNYEEDGFDDWLEGQEQRGVSVEVGLSRFPPFFNNDGDPSPVR
jgi:hypothetical protein